MDEYTTWRVINLSSHAELLADRYQNGHLPGYFAGLRFWSLLAGESEIALRFPSAICMAFCAASVVVLAHELLSARPAFLAGVFFALHQLTFWSAQTARPYAPLLLALLIAMIGVCRVAKGASLWWLVPVAVGSAAAMAMQPLAGAVLAGWMLGMIPAARRDPGRVAALAAALVLAIAITQPLYARLASEQGNFAPKELRLPFKGLADGLARVYLGDFRLLWRSDLLEIIGQLALLAHFGLAWVHLKGARVGSLSVRWLVGSWVGAVLLALCVMAMMGSKSVLPHQRYYVVIMPALAIVAGAALVGPEGWSRSRFNVAGLAIFAPVVVYTGAWLAQGGDGPKRVVSQVTDPLPALAIGNTLAFQYEWRESTVRFLPTLDPAEARAAFDAAKGDRQPVWLVIYENKRSPLQEIYKNGVEGWEVRWRLEEGDARVAAFEPR